MSLRLFDQALFADLLRQAALSPRRRAHHNLHAMDEPCHRLVVGMCADSYVPPHRHLDPHKAESLLVLQGRLGLLSFDEQGGVLQRQELSQAAGCLGVDLAPGHYHALVALGGDCLFFECKAGPFVPLGEGERPAWAPLEGTADAPRYHAWLRAQFD
ncbi:cupin [Pseudomonas oryzihabitans]|uniref:WbuC family cupin fold metalloprotein n=1 Tax=Pseudomonas rhizoryzae TaxID=2571129 RepID=UPI0007363ABB|nr:WbuC family cupin fold metalloprotein [Pseudomonas rhizoryzae]KTS71671.1 cupin [Pseudomonas psychrotolerans]KTT05326.1 cupin [Pseudomonas psychrotolerans]KTT22661.1 cupin [Pseudomonas psychrotolerans]KTT29608.1 cupin [Pseudomonas psychrotolerans]KTT33715.1 cupin [Pseudomonas psychrotolerans]